ncbi:MAG: hypothetical protein KBS81_05500 [Spirochaetales bacterium]|nr:hypothetical protein [Candidatus Physcosoma equi]
MEQKLYLTIGDVKVSATLVDNSSTRALLEKLASGPVTYEAHDYGAFEKVGDLPWSLPRNDQEIDTVPGDLILYLGRSLCIYYGNNQWDFTRMGTLDHMTQALVKDFVLAGKGNVKVTLSLE